MSQWQVIIVDNRGIGYSYDSAPSTPLTIPDLASSIVDFVSALGLPSPPDILGSSMGAMIALSIAALHDGAAHRIVSVSGSAGASSIFA